MKVDDTVRVTWNNSKFVCKVTKIEGNGFGGIDCNKPDRFVYFLWSGVQKLSVLT